MKSPTVLLSLNQGSDLNTLSVSWTNKADLIPDEPFLVEMKWKHHFASIHNCLAEINSVVGGRERDKYSVHRTFLLDELGRRHYHYRLFSVYVQHPIKEVNLTCRLIYKMDPLNVKR